MSSPALSQNMSLSEDESSNHLDENDAVINTIRSSGEDTDLKSHLSNSSCTNTPPEDDVSSLGVTTRAYQYEMLEKSLKENVIVVVRELLRGMEVR